MTNDAFALQQRVEALENRLRGQRRLITLGLLLGAAGLLMAPTPPPRPVYASAFVLVDPAGQTRGQIALAEDGAANFLLKNATGTSDAGLVVDATGGSALRLRSDKRDLTLQVASDGRAQLSIHQKHAKTAVVVGIDAAGVPSVVVNDKLGKLVFDSRQ